MSPTPSAAAHADVWKLVSENALVAGIIAAIVVALLGWLVKVLRDRRDSSAIYEFLIQSAAHTEHTFRTTHAISAATHIPESRVAELAGRDRRITRNQLEAQSWRLT
jgi:hypothetical protein